MANENHSVFLMTINNKKLSCRRETTRCIVFVCSQLQHVYSVVFYHQLLRLQIYLQQFLSYSNRKCKKSPFSHTAAHIFVSPMGTPLGRSR